MPVNLVISGCCGRMGQRIASLALADSVFAIAGALEAEGHQAVGQDLGVALGGTPIGVPVRDSLEAVLQPGAVLIEFTQPEPTVAHAQAARQRRVPMVIGTTGLSEEQKAVIAAAAREIPIVLSPNMSVGVNVLFELVETAARRLGSDYTIAVEETHRAGKKDRPSGTAKHLQALLATARGHTPDCIPCTSIRTGEVVGDHVVRFEGRFERLSVSHQALSRDVFALGALKAAAFLANRKAAGLYDMSDVLQAPR